MPGLIALASGASADECATASLRKQSDGRYVFSLSNRCETTRRWAVKVCYGKQTAMDETFATEAGMSMETPPFHPKHSGEPRLLHNSCEGVCVPVIDDCDQTRRNEIEATQREIDTLLSDPGIKAAMELFGDEEPPAIITPAPPAKSADQPVLDAFKNRTVTPVPTPASTPTASPTLKPLVLPPLPTAPGSGNPSPARLSEPDSDVIYRKLMDVASEPEKSAIPDLLKKKPASSATGPD